MAQATRHCSLVGELETDVEIKASAKKFHQMRVGRLQDLSKATPDIVQQCNLVEGELGKVGSIISWKYFDGQPKVAKERIEAVDSEKSLLVLRFIDGDIMKEFKSFLNTIQATPKQRGPGSVVKCHFKYERIDEKVAHPESSRTVCPGIQRYGRNAFVRSLVGSSDIQQSISMCASVLYKYLNNVLSLDLKRPN